MSYLIKTIEWLMDRFASNKEILESHKELDLLVHDQSIKLCKQNFDDKRELENYKIMIGALKQTVEDQQEALEHYEEDQQEALPKVVRFTQPIDKKKIEFEIYYAERGRK